MTRRSGSTLVEVLIAIFVMGIGLIALLTLFPLGALRMAKAIHDDKCAQFGRNANSLAVIHNIRNDLDVVSAPGIPDVFVNPNPAPGIPALKDADPYGESYAILVDPIGYNQTSGTNAQDWVGGVTSVLRRRPVEFARRKPGGGYYNPAVPAQAAAINRNIYQSFALMDDLQFENATGAAAPPGAPQKVGAAIFRNTRFSAAYLLRRPQTADPGVVDCSVVIFDTRTIALPPVAGGPAMTLTEYVYQTSYFDPTRNAITIDYTNNTPPPIRPGSWILDATISNPTGTTGTQHAYFYRVVATEDIVIPGPPAQTLTRYEVQTPIRSFPDPWITPPPPPTAYGYLGTAIVLDGIAEVFEKGPGRAP